MAIQIKVSKATLDPVGGYDMNLEFDGFKTKEIIEQLETEDVLECFEIKQILKQFDHSELLDEMDVAFIKEYLTINEETEL